MSPRLEVRLFGGISIHQEGKPIPKLASRKAEALFAYLICNPDTHQRETVASLLWDDRTPQQARGNLRVVIASLRQELNAYLHLGRSAPLSVKQNDSLWVDVYEFGDYLADIDLNVNLVRDFLHGLQSVPPLTEIEKSNLQNALSLYGGQFLYGLNLNDASGFDEWVTTERRKYAHLAYFAADRLASHALTIRDYQGGIEWAQMMLKLDVLNEEGHRKLMVLHYLNGQRNAAIDQYDIIEGMLEDEMGVPPSPETYNLFKQIRDSTLEAPAPNPKTRSSLPKRSVTPSNQPTNARPPVHQQQQQIAETPEPRQDIPHNLTQSLNPIFGRQREIELLTEHLFHPVRRLITISGLGGIGKTRLAEEVAWCSYEEAVRKNLFPNGIFFVSLSAVPSPELISFAIAEAIDLDITTENISKGVDGLHPLIQKLKSMNLLLILDNFEHLTTAVDLVRELLLQVPGLTVLATSREHLGMRGEWRLELVGLAYGEMLPPEDINSQSDDSSKNSLSTVEPKPNPRWLTATLNNTPPALAFFAMIAEQVQAGFTLSQENLVAVWQICASVEGLPLGIELAASLVNDTDCAEIAKGVAANKDMLKASMWDIPERQRSLRAVYNHSWSLLNESERTILSYLGVFVGGFSVAAAESVTNADANALRILASKSFIREANIQESSIQQNSDNSPTVEIDSTVDKDAAQDGTKRYESHVALHQYIHEILAADADCYAEIQTRHAQYYCNKLSHHPKLLASPQAALAASEIAVDFQNIRAAWQWAVDNRQLEVVEKLLSVLAPYHQLRGLNRQGETLFRSAVKALEDIGEDDSHEAIHTICLLLIELARYEQIQSKYDESISSVRRVIKLAQQIGDEGLMAQGYYRWGITLTRLGDAEKALMHIQSAVELAQKAGNEELRAHSLYQSAVIDWQRGNYALAAAGSEQAIEIYSKLSYPRGHGNALILQGIVCSFQGNFEVSCASYDKALRIYREIDDLYGQGFVINNLGRVWAERGDYRKSDEFYALSLSLNEQANNPYNVSSTILSQGRDAIWRGDFEAAYELLEEALARKIQTQDRHGEVEALIYKSFLAYQEGYSQSGLSYAEEALSIATVLEDRSMQAYAHLNLARALQRTGNLVKSASAYQTAYEIRESLGQRNLFLEPLAGLAYINYKKGEYSDALELIQPILHHLEEGTLEGIDDPMCLLYTCYLILKDQNELSSHVEKTSIIEKASTMDADNVLNYAYQLLIERSKTIAETTKRKLYLENIESHRAILYAYKD